MNQFDQILRDSLVTTVATWKEAENLDEWVNLARAEFEEEIADKTERLAQLQQQCKEAETNLRQLVEKRRVSADTQSFLGGVVRVQDRKVVAEYDKSPDGKPADWVKAAYPDLMTLDWAALKKLPLDSELIRGLRAWMQENHPEYVLPDWKGVESLLKKSAGDGWTNPVFTVEIKPTAAFTFDKLMTELDIMNEVDQRQAETES